MIWSKILGTCITERRIQDRGGFSATGFHGHIGVEGVGAEVVDELPTTEAGPTGTMTATVFAGNIALSDIHCGTMPTIA